MLKPKVFQGGYGPEAYLSWTAHMDSCFWHHHMPGYERLPLVIKQLRGEAATWWNLEEEDRWYYNEPAINTWEELKLLMDKRYIPKDFPEEIKECYGRRPIRKRAPQATSKSKMSITLMSKEPKPPDPPKESPCHPSPPVAIEKEKRAEEVKPNSSNNTRLLEQVLRTKLPQEGGYDAVIKPKDEVHEYNMDKPLPKAPFSVFTSLSRGHTSEDPWKTSPRPNLPFMDPKGTKSQWFFTMLIGHDLERFYSTKRLPRMHHYMPKLSRYKEPPTFPHLANKSRIKCQINQTFD